MSGHLTDEERRVLLMAYRDGVLAPGAAVLIEVARILAARVAAVLDDMDQLAEMYDSAQRRWEGEPVGNTTFATVASHIRSRVALHRGEAPPRLSSTAYCTCTERGCSDFGRQS